MRFRTYLLSSLLVISASANSFGQTDKPPAAAEVKPAAPAFSVTSLDGKKLDLASLRGKVIVFNFWFTGCEPCVAEMPELNSLVDKFKNKHVVFIAPTWDNEATLRTFLKDHSFKYQVVPNAGHLILGAFSDGTGNVAFPTHLIIDKEGKIHMRVVGPLVTKAGTKTFKDVRKAIARLADAPFNHAK